MAYAHPFLASDQWKACLSRIVLNGTRDRILEEMETIQNRLANQHNELENDHL